MVDLLFANGTIVDGTGAPGYRGSVAVVGDSLRVITGDVAAVAAARTVDAGGYVICPGFIDMHSHSDLKLLTEPAHEAKIRQGVTTEALGMDGLSYAPTTPRGLEQLLTYLAAVNGAPPDARWSSVADFLALFDGDAACNVLHFVPHAAIRVAAMGWSSRLPTAAELDTMRELTRQGMRDGAFGFTTGLTYAPGAYSNTDELAAIAGVAAEEGGFYCTHARYTLGDRLLDPFREALEIGRRSGAPVHISHYHSPVAGLGRQMTALVDEALNRGQDVTYDQYPYPAASTILHSLLPYWAHAGGPQALLARIADPAARALMVRAVEPQWGGQTLDNYIFAHIASDRNKEWGGPFPGGTGAASGGTDGGRRVRPAAGGKSTGRFRGAHRQFGEYQGDRVPPGADDRHRRHPHRRTPQPAHLRNLSLCAGAVRAGRGPVFPGGGCPQDDRGAGPAAGLDRPGRHPQRRQSRPGGVPPAAGGHAGHL